jgi:phosphohistidine phosphatase
MPTLSLLRHAKAAQPLPGQDDFDRPLTGRGRNDAQLMAPVLAGQKPVIALVSAAARTRETWEIAGREIRPAPALLIERALYLCPGDALVARLRELPDDAASAVLVGHNPGIHDAALWLAGHSGGQVLADLKSGFPTAALAVFSIDGGWADLAPASARLDRYVTARSLR